MVPDLVVVPSLIIKDYGRLSSRDEIRRDLGSIWRRSVLIDIIDAVTVGH